LSYRAGEDNAFLARMLSSAPRGSPHSAGEAAEDRVRVAGTLAFDDDVTVRVFSPLTGRVTKIMARVGDRVRKGDALALVESPEVRHAVDDVRKAEADLIAAERNLGRARDLFDRLTIARADLEVSEEMRRTAFAALERAKWKERLLPFMGVDTLSDPYTLVAPIDGEILARSLAPGQEVEGRYAGAGDPPALFTVGTLDRVSLLGEIFGVDLGRVRVGAMARLVTTAYPDQVFDGEVDWISGGLDPDTGTARVRLTFPNTNQILKPMMYGEAWIAASTGGLAGRDGAPLAERR
jgi:cobalt-zinc-cadmium efflux system membrane fusion protein